jgi:hypothetical protein
METVVEDSSRSSRPSLGNAAWRSCWNQPRGPVWRRRATTRCLGRVRWPGSTVPSGSSRAVEGQPAATFESRNIAAGIGRRRRHTNEIGRSPLCDT